MKRILRVKMRDNKKSTRSGLDLSGASSSITFMILESERQGVVRKQSKYLQPVYLVFLTFGWLQVVLLQSRLLLRICLGVLIPLPLDLDQHTPTDVNRGVVV